MSKCHFCTIYLYTRKDITYSIGRLKNMENEKNLENKHARIRPTGIEVYYEDAKSIFITNTSLNKLRELYEMREDSTGTKMYDTKINLYKILLNHIKKLRKYDLKKQVS